MKKIYVIDLKLDYSGSIDLFMWCVKNFGVPEKNTWGYGKDDTRKNYTHCSGPHEIEWYAFEDESMYSVFLLRWK